MNSSNSSKSKSAKDKNSSRRKVVLLGIDPGKANQGIAVVSARIPVDPDLNLMPKKVKVLKNQVMDNPIQDLKHAMANRKAFIAELDEWVASYQPQGIVAERFQTRGNMGPTIECVAYTLGIMAERAFTKYKIPIKLVIASSWKNDFHRAWNPDRRVERKKVSRVDRKNSKNSKNSGLELDLLYKEMCVPAHQVDASLIALYGIEQGTGIEIHKCWAQMVGSNPLKNLGFIEFRNFLESINSSSEKQIRGRPTTPEQYLVDVLIAKISRNAETS